MSTETATITPAPDADTCEEQACREGDLLARVNPHNAEARVLCPTHRVLYLREVSEYE